MTAKAKLPWRNRNVSGWWIARYLDRFEYYDEKKSDLNRRCVAWENTIIVKALSREAAYKKVIALGRLGEGSEARNSRGRKGAWRFEGLTLLLPIYDKLTDLTEILWTEHSGRSVRSIKAMVRSKSELPVFDDTEGDGSERGKKRRIQGRRGKGRRGIGQKP